MKCLDWSVVLCSSYWKVMHLGMNAISLRRSKAASDCQGGCKMGGMATLLWRLELSSAGLNDIF